MILSRRAFIAATLGSALFPNVAFGREPSLAPRIRGMLLGSLIGDAAGGPLEFKTREELHRPPISFHGWGAIEAIDADSLDGLAKKFSLRSYDVLRPGIEPYGQWRRKAPAGTVTDDTRFKIIVMRMLREAHERKAFPVSAGAFAQAINRHYENPPEHLAALYKEWLYEFAMAARWELGERDRDKALPPSRIWGGIPTVSGQMALLPIAALFPGEPESAYKAAYELAFLDNGAGKDVTAAIIAGLSESIKVRDPRDAWDAAIDTMIETDPYRFGEVPWVPRSVAHWVDEARAIVNDAQRRPARLFALLEERLGATTYWEAHVPLTCAVAVMEFCDQNPLAAMQLMLEFGHDTDSNTQLLGAFIGAAHGEAVFPSSMREQVAKRLHIDYGESVTEWTETLGDVARLHGKIVESA